MSHLVIHARSALMLAGTSPPRGGGDAATARWADGRPFLPGTALRGALRIALERLLRGAASQGGAAPIDPDGDDPVERLFGGVDREGLLRVGNGLLEEPRPDANEFAVRHGVGLDRRRRSVRRSVLFQRETTAPGLPARFRAPLELAPGATDADRRLVEAAAAAVVAIGGGRSRGTGFVRMEVHWSAPHTAEARHDIRVGETRELEVEATLLEPLQVGSGRPLGTHHTSLDWIPGSALRGALGTALAAAGHAGRPEFARLFGLDGEAGASFGDLLPGGGRVIAESVRACRVCGREVDFLPELILQQRLLEFGVPFHWTPTCPGEGCRGTKWDRLPPVDAAVLRRGLWTRVAMDRRRGRAKDGMLHSFELVEPIDLEGGPTRFSGRITRLDPAAAALLGDVGGLHVRIGHGRSRGFGEVRLEVRPVTGEDSLLERRERFERRLREAAQGFSAALGIPPERLLPSEERLFPVKLLSRWVPADGRGPNGDLDPAAAHPLAGVEVAPPPFLALRTPVFHGGWDGRAGGAGRELRSLRCFERGGIFVYRLPEAAPVEAWERMGREGTGRLTERGCGRFQAYPPLATGAAEDR